MSAGAGFAAFGQRRAKREVIDVPERKVEDRSLDKLLHVRKQRLDRLERERNEARESWRATRLELREAKDIWRDAVEDASQFWQQARAEFFRMSTTSGQFRKAKAIYERMKSEAAQRYVECREAVQRCRRARVHFFEARVRVMQANKQQEKLGILRDEIRAMNLQDEG